LFTFLNLLVELTGWVRVVTEDKIIKLDKARAPHDVARKEAKVEKMKQAFIAARVSGPSTSAQTLKNRKRRTKKKK
jgi:hypothetical protein